ncbi:PqqD family protein [Bacillus timonensis]|uniref:PqqD family protein n=1 Tax=Bacillus timonensis TaxID=1033734 RepID=UPI000289F192|nr:PqqD family protein [Bacillus timonensis]
MNQYIKKSNYDITQLEDEWIILNTDNYTITKLNQIGGFCWHLLDKSQSPNSLLQEIKENYNSSTTFEDVENYLQQLIQCGLVEHAG